MKQYKYAEEWNMYPGDDLNCKSEEERKERGMLLNPDVKIDFPVPLYIQKKLEALDECYEIGAWYAWDNILSALEMDAKEAYAYHKISYYERYQLLNRFYYW